MTVYSSSGSQWGVVKSVRRLFCQLFVSTVELGGAGAAGGGASQESLAQGCVRGPSDLRHGHY